jgi:hypothetical protein
LTLGRELRQPIGDGAIAEARGRVQRQHLTGELTPVGGDFGCLVGKRSPR